MEPGLHPGSFGESTEVKNGAGCCPCSGCRGDYGARRHLVERVRVVSSEQLMSYVQDWRLSLEESHVGSELLTGIISCLFKH